MREITHHKIEGYEDGLMIRAMDRSVPGGPCREYVVSGAFRNAPPTVTFHFQDGPIGEVGVNGVTIEALLAMYIDQLQGFQAGEFACEDNKDALRSLRCAMADLHARTEDRIKRGVEGRSVA